MNNPQDVFGGAETKGSLPDDKFGTRYFKCPKGHENTRWIKDELVEKCQKCGIDVSCKKK